MGEKYFGKTLLCRTQFAGKPIAGRVSFSQEAIDVKLVGFEDFVYFDHDSSTVLQLEDNQFCTVRSSSTSPGSRSTADLKNHYLDIAVRQAILGFRPWRADDLIHEFQFKLSDTNGFLTAPDIQKKITSANIDHQPETKIFEAETGGVKITISFSYNFNWFDGSLQVSDVVGNVVFNEAETIEGLSRLIGKLRTFFTMAAGIEVSLSDYWIMPKEGHKQPILGGGTAPARFQLIWPRGREGQPTNYGKFKPAKLLNCWGEADRDITSKCLEFWMDNWELWEQAFSGVFTAIREGRVFNPNRIINACKWLEATPGAKQLKLDRRSELKAVTKAATAEAERLGLDISGRIAGAIGHLGTESRSDLFKRLIDLVVMKADPAVKKRFLTDLLTAYRLRGDFAHSRFYHTSDEDFGEYTQATQAVEALAYLLLVRSLPHPKNDTWPHENNNFIEYLRLL